MSRPPLGLHRSFSGNAAKSGLGITLAARSSSGSRHSSEKVAAAAPVKGLRPGEVLDKDGIAGRPIFIIRNADGAPVGVRKIAMENDPLPGHFTATQVEARTYRHLTTIPGWREHILPFRDEKSTDDTVTIDFDWLDGEDVQKYLEKYPNEFLLIMRQILMQLRWLAQHGYIHGDIKLDNFYRAADGRILLFDFGRAGRVAFASVMSELMAVARIITPYNADLGFWLKFHAMDEYAHIVSFKDKLAEIYLKTVSKLIGRKTSSSKKSSNSSKSRKSSSNSKKSRKSRKSSSSSRLR
jgi:serine/threonine protein kinase